MTITTPRTKTDQTGETAFAKSIFANPMKPSVCPILALAVATLCRPLRSDSPSTAAPQLFDGNDQEDRFSNILSTVLTTLSTSKAALLGAKAEHIGTHSARKGAASYTVTVVDGPSSVATFLRAGWSLGNTKDRYIFEGEGGDQLCGRVVCGLSTLNETFAVLPPHFLPEALLSITDFEWRDVVPGFDHYPETFRQCIPYLLASVVHHEEFLRTSLSAEHTLFHTRVFASGLINRLRGTTVTGIGQCVHTGMHASGVPTSVMTHCRVVELGQQLSALKDFVHQTLSQTKEDIITAQLTVPGAVKETLLQNFAVDGVAPLTREDLLSLTSRFDTIDSRINDVRADMLATLQDRLTSTHHLPGTVPASSNVGPSAATSSAEQLAWGTWDWDGRFHPVPRGWRFPRHGVKIVFLEWIYGNRGCRPPIKPLRFLRKNDVSKEGL